jgi:hypothetical protein
MVKAVQLQTAGCRVPIEIADWRMPIADFRIADWRLIVQSSLGIQSTMRNRRCAVDNAQSAMAIINRQSEIGNAIGSLQSAICNGFAHE